MQRDTLVRDPKAYIMVEWNEILPCGSTAGGAFLAHANIIFCDAISLHIAGQFLKKKNPSLKHLSPLHPRYNSCIPCTLNKILPAKARPTSGSKKDRVKALT